MKQFKSARHLQRFVPIHDPIANLFHFLRHSLTALEYQAFRSEAISVWQELASAHSAA